eukprot:5017978-Prymnesium_polylepis.2
MGLRLSCAGSCASFLSSRRARAPAEWPPRSSSGCDRCCCELPTSRLSRRTTDRAACAAVRDSIRSRHLLRATGSRATQ